MIGSPPGVGTLPPGWSQLVDPATVSDFTDLSFFPFFTVFFAMSWVSLEFFVLLPTLLLVQSVRQTVNRLK
jgi:hypothetical protein